MNAHSATSVQFVNAVYNVVSAHERLDFTKAQSRDTLHTIMENATAEQLATVERVIAESALRGE